MEDMENLNVMKEFSNKYYDEMRKWGHVNLIIAGKTGVGKSTLLNAALGGNLVKTGIGRPITDLGDVKWYEKDGVPLRIMDTVGLELDAEKRRRSLKAIKNEIKNNFLIGIIRGLAKNIGSEVYENYKNTLGNKYEKCCQDIIIIIIVEIEIKIDSFQQYENNNILEENPNYIPPTRPFYPLR